MSEPLTAARPGWLRFGLADLLFIVVALGILQTTKDGTLDDPGLGWHIRQVDAMWEQGGWLTTDPFCGPKGGQPWITNQWVGDLLLWLGNGWGSLNGIAAVTTLVLALAYRSLYGMLRADGLSWPTALLWAWLGALGSYQAWLARPNFFTFWFVLLTARMCDLYHRGRCSERSLLWLLPLFALWANCHGGFLAGLIILGVSTVVEAGVGWLSFTTERRLIPPPEEFAKEQIPADESIRNAPNTELTPHTKKSEPTVLPRGDKDILSFTAEQRTAARRRAMVFALLTGGAFLATLVNPYGWHLYPWILKLLGNPFFMDLNSEWKAPDFHMTGAFRFEMLILLFPLLLAFSRHRSSLVNLALAVVWLHFGLNGIRYIPLWVAVAVPLLARLSVEIPWIQEGLKRIQLSDDLWKVLRRPPGKPAYGGTLVFCIGLAVWARWGPPYAGFYPERIPAKALDEFLVQAEKLPPDRVAFHHIDWGGYLTWHGWPKFKTWIDDRNELQGQDHIQECLHLLSARAGWEDKLRSEKIDLVCVPPSWQLEGYLAVNPEWEKLYEEKDGEGKVVAVIYRRKSAEAR
jgi:hypothetical protein